METFARLLVIVLVLFTAGTLVRADPNCSRGIDCMESALTDRCCVGMYCCDLRSPQNRHRCRTECRDDIHYCCPLNTCCEPWPDAQVDTGGPLTDAKRSYGLGQYAAMAIAVIVPTLTFSFICFWLGRRSTENKFDLRAESETSDLTALSVMAPGFPGYGQQQSGNDKIVTLYRSSYQPETPSRSETRGWGWRTKRF